MVKVGTTATLELTPDQTKVLAVAQQMADRLSLALRSVADAQEQDTSAADYLLSGDNGSAIIQVIKSGSIAEILGTRLAQYASRHWLGPPKAARIVDLNPFPFHMPVESLDCAGSST